jgi:hypothetical protein
MTGVISWVATWAIMLVAISFLAQTQWGKPIVYWFLWLAVLLLVVSHSEELTQLFDVGALQLNG